MMLGSPELEKGVRRHVELLVEYHSAVLKRRRPPVGRMGQSTKALEAAVSQSARLEQSAA